MALYSVKHRNNVTLPVLYSLGFCVRDFAFRTLNNSINTWRDMFSGFRFRITRTCWLVPESDVVTVFPKQNIVHL
jgi:hypothetical protein